MRTLEGNSAEHQNDVAASFRQLEVARLALVAAEEDYELEGAAAIRGQDVEYQQ